MTSLSVVVTFYNNVEHVASALAQVDALAGDDFELVLLDDGSTDGTAELLRARARAAPGVKLLVNEKNRGIAESRNRAVLASSGEYVLFLDCDDAWSPEIVNRLAERARQSGADVAVCGAARVYNPGAREGRYIDGRADGEFSGRSAMRLLLTGAIRGYVWNKLIRRELLLLHPFPKRRAQEDLAVIIQLIADGALFSIMSEVLYWHVERPGSLTNSRIESFESMSTTLIELERIVSGSMEFSGLDSELDYYRQWAFRNSLVNTAVRLGVTDKALERFVRALRRETSLRSILTTARYSRREAAIAFLIRFAGACYPRIYRRYRALTHGGRTERKLPSTGSGADLNGGVCHG